MRIKGGPELRARLAAIAAAKPELGRAWGSEAAKRIRDDAPRRSGDLRQSIKEGRRGGKAAVFGLWYGIILDRGTKAYRIKPRTVGGTLRYSYKGRTIFSKQANRRRLRRRPFITKGAQGALQSPAIAGAIVQAWNRKRSSGRFSRL